MRFAPHWGAVWAALCLVATTPAGSAQAPALAPAPNAEVPRKAEVFVVLNGGLAGPNLSRILDFAYATGSRLPVRSEVVPAGGGSACGILTKLHYPPPCDRYYPLLRRLNGRPVDTLTLQPNEQIRVPDIALVKERRTRILAGRNKARDAAYRSKWKKLFADVRPVGAEDTAVTYDAYVFHLVTPDDAAAKTLSNGIRALGLDNITADARLSIVPAPQLFDDPQDIPTDPDVDLADQIEEECRGGRLTNPRAYADWATSDRSARPITKVLPRQPSTVVLIDTPLTPGDYYAKPRLADDAEWPSWPCAWRKAKKYEHANYLAAIIATRANGNGMIGVAEQALLESLPWVRVASDQLQSDGEAPARVAKALLDDAKPADPPATKPMKVYLAALDFRIWTEEDTAYNASIRLDRDPAGPIASTGRLFVVAAGQQADGGRDITAASRMSPQNLGDLNNVVVVSACRQCGQAGVRLLDSANYSGGEHRFVQVAAPGGAILPGWLDSKSMGPDLGTSPASAFVAAVAADMVGAYPAYYLDARRLKDRLQMSSQPLPRYTAFNEKNPDIEKIATGVVDPYVALLNPTQHWIKQDAKWRSVRIKALTITLLDNRGQITGGGQPWLRRLVRRGDIVDPDAWTAFEQTRRDPSEPIGDARTLYNVRPSKGSTVTLCNGTLIKLLALEDLLLAQAGWNGNECSSG